MLAAGGYALTRSAISSRLDRLAYLVDQIAAVAELLRLHGYLNRV